MLFSHMRQVQNESMSIIRLMIMHQDNETTFSKTSTQVLKPTRTKNEKGEWLYKNRVKRVRTDSVQISSEAVNDTISSTSGEYEASSEGSDIVSNVSLPDSDQPDTPVVEDYDASPAPEPIDFEASNANAQENVDEESETTVEDSSNTHAESSFPTNTSVELEVSMSSRSVEITHADTTDYIHLPGMKSTIVTQRKCCICGSHSGRHRIPTEALLQAWSEVEVFLPHGNRCCKSHIKESLFNEEALHTLKSSTALKSYTVMNRNRLMSWIKDLTQFLKTQRSILNFGRDTRFTSTDFEILLGVSKENFETLFQCCNKDIKNSKNRYKLNLACTESIEGALLIYYDFITGQVGMR